MKINDTLITTTTADITTQHLDGIVNAANSSLMGGGGVDGAIHRAGGPSILGECKEIVERTGRLPTGKAVSTTAGDLPAKRVIHTVGPVWYGGERGEAELLASAYTESLKVAVADGLKSVGFPSISTGAYRYPVAKAAEVAVKAVARFLAADTGLEEVRFVLFSEEIKGYYDAALANLEGLEGLEGLLEEE